jgi:hypothetical protein
MLRLRVAHTAIAKIDNVGGIDNFLLHSKDEDLGPLGMKWRDLLLLKMGYLVDPRSIKQRYSPKIYDNLAIKQRKLVCKIPKSI